MPATVGAPRARHATQRGAARPARSQAKRLGEQLAQEHIQKAALAQQEQQAAAGAAGMAAAPAAVPGASGFKIEFKGTTSCKSGGESSMLHKLGDALRHLPAAMPHGMPPLSARRRKSEHRSTKSLATPQEASPTDATARRDGQASPAASCAPAGAAGAAGAAKPGETKRRVSINEPAGRANVMPV